MRTVAQVIRSYNEGEITLIEATIELRQIRKAYEVDIQEIKNFENNNLEFYEAYKDDSYNGYEFKVVNGGTTYDYSKNEKIKSYTQLIEEEKALAKTAYMHFQANGERLITEHGEEIDLPEIGYRKSYLKVTKSK